MDPKIAIIGNGFVGAACSRGFKSLSQYIIDPITHPDNTYKGLYDFNPQFIFVCVPTPMAVGGGIDVSGLVESVGSIDCPNAVIVIKSTVIADIINDIYEDYDNVVYNPEFLREQYADYDFENPTIRVMGGDIHNTVALRNLYNDHTSSQIVSCHLTDVRTASWIKYSANAFLAMKVTFFNQMQDAFTGDDWPTFTRAMSADPRIGVTHTQVPGPDGRRGYGGACFTKDINALNHHYDIPLLEEVSNINREYRSCYDPSEREISQKVVY
jgi:UDPglucose 6-dehydrogenase